MGLSTTAIVGVSVGLGLAAVLLAFGVPFLVIYCGWCHSPQSASETDGEVPGVGGIPLGSKPPKLTDDQRIVRETAMRRYKRRLRREAHQKRKEEGEEHQLGDPTEESTVSEDTVLTASTLPSTVLYGRGVYDHEKSFDSRTNSRNLSRRSSWNGKAGSGRQRKAKQRHRQRFLRSEKEYAGAGHDNPNTWEIPFDSDSEVEDASSESCSPSYQPPNEPAAHEAPRWTREWAEQNMKMSGFLAPSGAATHHQPALPRRSSVSPEH